MKKLSIFALALAAALVMTQAASATTLTFPTTFTIQNYNSSFVLTGTVNDTAAPPQPNVSGFYTFTSFTSGTVTDSALWVGPQTLTLVNPALGYGNNDEFSPTSPYFTGNGFLFEVMNIHAAAVDYIYVKPAAGGNDTITVIPTAGPPVVLTITGKFGYANNAGNILLEETPEPTSLLLLGTGLLGLAFVAFRKAKATTGTIVQL
jgi:hypothetical protein